MARTLHQKGGGADVTKLKQQLEAERAGRAKAVAERDDYKARFTALMSRTTDEHVALDIQEVDTREYRVIPDAPLNEELSPPPPSKKKR